MSRPAAHDPTPTPPPSTPRARFLVALETTGVVRVAAEASGVSRATLYRWREEDPEFATSWDRAIDSAADALEAEARRRGVEGWDEPVFHQGVQVATIRRYSDRMLELLLKAHRPKLFRDSAKVELSGPHGGPVATRTEHAPLTDEHYAGLIRIALAAGFVAPPDLAPASPASTPALPSGATPAPSSPS